MDKKVVGVIIDGAKKEKITIGEANERKKTFSPLLVNNICYKELRNAKKKVKTTNYGTSFDLENLIKYLQEIHSKFGNMDVLYYNGKTECFTRPSLSDIDVVKRYFTISGNMETKSMEIKNDKALSFFHS